MSSIKQQEVAADERQQGAGEPLKIVTIDEYERGSVHEDLCVGDVVEYVDDNGDAANAPIVGKRSYPSGNRPPLYTIEVKVRGDKREFELHPEQITSVVWRRGDGRQKGQKETLPMRASKKARKVVKKPEPKLEYEDRGSRAIWRFGGKMVHIGADFQLWRNTEGLVEMKVPVSPAELRAMHLGPEWKHVTLEPELVGWDKSALPPLELLRAWADILKDACEGEAMVMVCRRFEIKSTDPINSRGWLGLVPKQRATGGGVEIEDSKKAVTWAYDHGYEPIGVQAHLHPGSMTGYSGTDREDAEKWPGVHLILPRELNVVSIYLSAGGHVVGGGRRELPEFEDEKEKFAVCDRLGWLVDDEGQPYTERIRAMIQKPSRSGAGAASRGWVEYEMTPGGTKVYTGKSSSAYDHIRGRDALSKLEAALVHMSQWQRNRLENGVQGVRETVYESLLSEMVRRAPTLDDLVVVKLKGNHTHAEGVEVVVPRETFVVMNMAGDTRVESYALLSEAVSAEGGSAEDEGWEDENDEAYYAAEDLEDAKRAMEDAKAEYERLYGELAEDADETELELTEAGDAVLRVAEAEEKMQRGGDDDDRDSDNNC